MNLENIFQKTPECLLEDMDGETLLYNPGNATTLHLNGPSTLVWDLCNGENSVAIIIDALQQAYPGQADQIEGDVTDVIKELSENDAIQKVLS
ncbi:MAG: ABC-type Zn uptake system ZnuABC Zn-binding protein ZnuA [Arenicella sp.]|jgi:ABC-type Zn uptake system ZnuABC Zn-binding protein ZnuA